MIHDSLMDKKSLRKEMIQKLNKLLPEDRYAQEKSTYRSLFKLQVWQEADKVAITMPLALEFNLEPLIEAAKQEQKQLFLPVMQEDKSLTFVRWDQATIFQEAAFGIKQPIEPQKSKAIELNDLDLIIVPGLAYSKDGARIGFGGGYYDRTLASYNGFTLSLAYSCQIFPKTLWLIEETDRPIDMIISNKGVYSR